MAFDFYQQYPAKAEKEKLDKQIDKEATAVNFPISRLATTTNPFVPKQLEEFGKMLNTGMKNFEIGTLEMKNFETIPDEHLKEIRRLSKLTDTNVSMHGPMMDWSGFGEKGKWSEQTRKEAEGKMLSVMKRAEILNDKGNMPVVFHAAHQSFSNFYDKTFDSKEKKDKLIESLEFLKSEAEKQKKEAEKYGDKEKIKEQEARIKSFENNREGFSNGTKQIVRVLGIVNTDTGESTGIEIEEKYVMGSDGKSHKVIFDPYSRLDEYNRMLWTKEKMNFNQLHEQEEQTNRRMESPVRELMQIRDNLKKLEELDQKKELDEAGRERKEELGRIYSENSKIMNSETNALQEHVRIIRRDREHLKEEIASKFFKLATKEQEGEFEKKAVELNKQLEKAREDYDKKISESKEDYERNYWRNKLESKKAEIEFQTIGAMATPKIFKPLEEFAQDKFAETVSNVLSEFAKGKTTGELNKAPMMCIENWVPTSPMSRGDTLREGIRKSREKFAEKLLANADFLKENKNEAKEKANQVAERLIGATWDMGHINQLRQSGIEGKELQRTVIEETQKIADMVKHVHITDNFGFEDSHLAAGMGNVPIREVLETLEKRGFKGRGILESGGVINAFGIQPHHIDLEYFHAPIYNNGIDAKTKLQKVRPPYWSAEYPNFYTDTFIEYPQQHFNMYGSGFSTLPKSLGGEAGTSNSRFSNTPNQ